MTTNIENNDMVHILLETFPEFEEYWIKHRHEWPEEESGPCIDMYPVIEFTVHLISQDDSHRLSTLFNVAEDLLKTGSQGVQDVVGPCYLESLVNRASAGSISSLDFIEYLGPSSKEFIRAWDEFTGVETEGLWN